MLSVRWPKDLKNKGIVMSDCLKLDDDIKKLQQGIINLCQMHIKLTIEKLSTISANYEISSRIEEDICSIEFLLEDIQNDIKSIPNNIQHSRDNK